MRIPPLVRADHQKSPPSLTCVSHFVNTLAGFFIAESALNNSYEIGGALVHETMPGEQFVISWDFANTWGGCHFSPCLLCSHLIRCLIFAVGEPVSSGAIARDGLISRDVDPVEGGKAVVGVLCVCVCVCFVMASTGQDTLVPVRPYYYTPPALAAALNAANCLDGRLRSAETSKEPCLTSPRRDPLPMRLRWTGRQIFPLPLPLPALLLPLPLALPLLPLPLLPLPLLLLHSADCVSRRRLSSGLLLVYVCLCVGGGRG